MEEHLDYVTDRARLEQFRAAIGGVVKPGDRVADLGCGTGILGLLCVQAGAAHVYAVDSTPIISVARETFARAQLSDRATFLSGRSYRVELPERVDVVVCDHVGYFGFDYGILSMLQDARQRLLRPGGQSIPKSMTLEIAAAESVDCQKKAVGWGDDGVPPEFRWLRHNSVNKKHAVHLSSEQLLGAPRELGQLDLGTNHSGCLTWSADLRIERNGIMHGLAGWFVCELAKGVSMTNSPFFDGAISRPQAFLPIDEPVSVKSGDVVEVTVTARPDEQLIAWTVLFGASGKRFAHSTWNGMLLGPEDLIRSRPDRVPELSSEGAARLTVLGYCDGHRTVRQIEETVLRVHPDLFPFNDEIRLFVTQVLARDTR